jgi:hypothetical protein
MSPGQLDPAVVRRHLLALDEAVQHLRRHAGRPWRRSAESDERWAVERGLQLCTQKLSISPPTWWRAPAAMPRITPPPSTS